MSINLFLINKKAGLDKYIMDLYLKIKASTWPRESHGLYDYDSANHVIQTLKVISSGYITRKENSIYYDCDSSLSSEGKLISIKENNDSYLIYPVKEETLGIVVKDIIEENQKGLKLFVGDMIKIGKVLLKVKNISEERQEEKINFDECEGSNTSDITCRICFRTHTNSYDPLLSICECSGTMALIHFKCLQKWIITKSVKKINAYCITYTWKSFDCDICKKRIPSEITYNEKKYDLLNIPIANSKCIILDDLRKEKYKYILHIITPDIAPITIGRSSDCDLKINDISVSRSHATINYADNSFFLMDNFSKFGTLVLKNRPILININKRTTVQVNRSIFQISLKRNSKFFKCFGCCKNKTKVKPSPKARTDILWDDQSVQSLNSPDNNK